MQMLVCSLPNKPLLLTKRFRQRCSIWQHCILNSAGVAFIVYPSLSLSGVTFGCHGCGSWMRRVSHLDATGVAFGCIWMRQVSHFEKFIWMQRVLPWDGCRLDATSVCMCG